MINPKIATPNFYLAWPGVASLAALIKGSHVGLLKDRSLVEKTSLATTFWVANLRPDYNEFVAIKSGCKFATALQRICNRTSAPPKCIAQKNPACIEVANARFKLITFF